MPASLPSLLPLHMGPLPSTDVPAYPVDRARPPEPLAVPWPMKSLGSARCGTERLADGRMSYWIRHDILKGVTPRMLAWWFSHLEGDVLVQGRRVNRYRAWHPYDHVHASYARRLADGSVGPGATIRLREYLGGNSRYEVNVFSDIEKLDEEGFIHNPRLHGVSGLVRMEYRFTRVADGTLYENRLLIGGAAGWRRSLSPLIQTLGFNAERGNAWLRHNIEEVGLFEQFLPDLYQQETGLES
jgi:DAPG hydrolase PhiG domain